MTQINKGGEIPKDFIEYIDESSYIVAIEGDDWYKFGEIEGVKSFLKHHLKMTNFIYKTMPRYAVEKISIIKRIENVEVNIK